MLTVENYSLDKRKNEGIFYTPPFLAQYLSKKTLHYWGGRKILSVIDPACGDSVLLRVFLEELAIKQVLSFPKIIGIDKDENAVRNSNLRIKEQNLVKSRVKFINTDALFPFNHENAQIGWSKVKDNTDCKNGFSIALSNPPWGSTINGYKSSTLNSNFTLAKGQFDIFDLFFETIYNNLSKNGMFGLILPDSVFSQEQTKFRELLVTNSTIHLIARLGEKIFPEINRACVIIIGEKTKPYKTHKVNCFRLSADYKKKVISSEQTLEDAEKELSHLVLQKRFAENKNFQFDIDLKTEEQDLYEKIKRNSVLVNDYLQSRRGAELSKKGIVCLCPSCSIWMPLPKSKNPKCPNCSLKINLETVKIEKIINAEKSSNTVKLKVGEDLFRYTSKSKSYIDISKNGINYKPAEIYEGTKILVRKTGIGVTASIDYENAMTNQVVYILRLKTQFKNLLTLEFILAILNSRVLTYYLIKKYGENEWRTHPYMTQTALMNLPLPKIDFEDCNVISIINKITKLVQSEVRNSKEKNISKKTDMLIERMVADFFDLNETDYETIFLTLNNSEQLIPIKRLLNCDIKEIFC